MSQQYDKIVHFGVSWSLCKSRGTGKQNLLFIRIPSTGIHMFQLHEYWTREEESQPFGSSCDRGTSESSPSLAQQNPRSRPPQISEMMQCYSYSDAVLQMITTIYHLRARGGPLLLWLHLASQPLNPSTPFSGLLRSQFTTLRSVK